LARQATLRILGVVVWGCFGAGGGFLAVEAVGWVLDPLVVLLLWRVCSRSRARDQFLAAYAIGYLAVTAHYLVPHLYAAWPSLAYRVYFGVLLLAGVVLLVASAWHVTGSRVRRPR
jgi:hypothetical protein